MSDNNGTSELHFVSPVLQGAEQGDSEHEPGQSKSSTKGVSAEVADVE
jgi:hypothetical protein